MDNITHSLVGAIVGICVANRLRSEQKHRAAIVGASILANNLPDIDLFYTWIIPGPLGYLLHHRGHTHTALFTLVAPLLLLLVFAALRIFRDKRFPTRTVLGAFLVVILGVPLHIALDSLNSYGVHPWWPLSNKWFYGDALFIVEPILWIVLSLGIYRSCEQKIAKLCLALVITGALGLLCFSGYVPREVTVLITLCGSAFALLVSQVSVNKSLIVAGFLSSLYLAGLIFLSGQVKQRLAAIHANNFNNETLQEVIVTSAPANPFCWSFILASTSSDGFYRLMRGVYSPSESVDRFCQAFFDVGDLAVQPITVPPPPQIRWIGMFQAPLNDLRAIAQNNCQVRAFLQFSRAPVFSERDHSIYLADLRFDRRSKRRRNFAALRINAAGTGSSSCPDWIPPWEMPRGEVMK